MTKIKDQPASDIITIEDGQDVLGFYQAGALVQAGFGHVAIQMKDGGDNRLVPCATFTSEQFAKWAAFVHAQRPGAKAKRPRKQRLDDSTKRTVILAETLAEIEARAELIIGQLREVCDQQDATWPWIGTAKHINEKLGDILESLGLPMDKHSGGPNLTRKA